MQQGSSRKSDADLRLPAEVLLIAGLGDRGCRVAAGLESLPPFGPADLEQASRLGRALLPVGLPDELAAGSFPHGGLASKAAGLVTDHPRWLAGRLLDRVHKMIEHRLVERARLAKGRGLDTHPTSAWVVIAADVGEEPIRRMVRPLLDALQVLAYERLRPVFTGGDGLVIVPLIATPYVRGAAARDAIASCMAELHEHVRAARVGHTPDRPRLSSLLVVEDVTSLSVLGRASMDAMLENFCLLLAEGIPARSLVGSDDEALRAGILGRQPAEPLATFSVARADPFDHRVWEALTSKLALDVLREVRTARLPGDADEQETVSELVDEGLPPTEMERARLSDRLEQEAEAEASKVPSSKNDRGLKEAMLSVLGPDDGDPAEETGPSEVSSSAPWIGLATANMDRVRQDLEAGLDRWAANLHRDFAAWEFGRETEPGVAQRMQRRLDELLGVTGDGSRIQVSSIRSAQQGARELGQALRAQLADAEQKRDHCTLPSPPNADSLREAHADALKAARALPDFRILLLGAALTTACLTIAFGALLRGLIHGEQVAGAVPPPLRTSMLAYGIAALLACGICGLIGWVVLRTGAKRARWTLEELRQRLRSAYLDGPSSLRAYFLSRIEYAWRVTHAGALHRLCEQIDRDRDRLESIDRAILGAEERYARRLLALGLDCSDPSAFDLSRTLPDASLPLVWPLGDAKRLTTLGDERVDAGHVLGRGEKRDRLLSGWRSTLPFLDDRVLDQALEPDVQELAGRRVALNDTADFEAAQRRSLPVCLSYLWRRSEDASIDRAEPLAGASGVTAESASESDAGVSVHGRRYYVRLHSGIAAKTVEWWPPSLASARPSTAQAGGIPGRSAASADGAATSVSGRGADKRTAKDEREP